MDVYPYFLVKNIPCLRESNSPRPLGEGLEVSVISSRPFWVQGRTDGVAKREHLKTKAKAW